MQWNFSHAFAPQAMMAGTTEWGSRGDLKYRFLSAMQGGVGIGNNLNHLSSDYLKLATDIIGDYKVVRETIQRGNLYRLVEPSAGAPFSDTLCVAADRHQAVWFHMAAVVTKRDDLAPVGLKGPQADGCYHAHVLGGGRLPPEVPEEATGEWLINQGTGISLAGDFRGIGIVLDRR